MPRPTSSNIPNKRKKRGRQYTAARALLKKLKHMKRHILYIVGCSALLASCNLYKNYERPEAMNQLDGLYRDIARADAALSDADTTNFGTMPWREVFTDPQLQTLIEKALANNTDMKKAELNIEKAQAGLKVAKLAYLPSLSFTPQGTISSYDRMKATQTYTLPLNASWNFGSWGSLRNNRKKYDVAVMQTKVAKQATQTAIIAGVANLYYTLGMLDEQLKTTQATIVLWKKNVETMEAMQEAAMTNQAAVSQTKANYYELLASVPQLENSIRQAENSLCLLINEAPHAIERGAFNADAFPAEMSAGVPLQLLSYRPDVKIAELNLASAFYGVNIARSAFYPSLTLSGTAGWTNSAGSMVVNPAKFIASAVGSIVQPLFANGTLRANLKITKIEQEQAELDFRTALLTAGQEVSNALSSYQTAIKQQENREKEVAEMEKALDYVNALFQHSNTTTYLETLTAQQSLLQSQLSLINDKYTKVQSAISLYQALGGGRE